MLAHDEQLYYITFKKREYFVLLEVTEINDTHIKRLHGKMSKLFHQEVRLHI